MKYLPIVAALLCAAPVLHAAPTGVEASMVASVDAQMPRTLALLEALVNQNSGTMNHDGVRKVGERVTAELQALGFTVRWVPMDEVRRAGHLIATHRGVGGRKRLLLIGHLDTVFELGYSDQPHLTKSLKRYLGQTPGQLARAAQTPGA